MRAVLSDVGTVSLATDAYAGAMLRVFAIVPYRLIMSVTIGITVVFGMSAALAFGSDDDAEPGMTLLIAVWIPLGAAVIVVALTIVLLRPWVYLRDIAAMPAGNAWAHWTYDEAGWASANAVEATRLRRTAFVGLLFALAASLVLVVVALPLDGEDGSALRFGGGLSAGAALVAIAALGGTSASLVARRRKRGDIYISPMGIYRRPGGYTPLLGYGYRLRDVTLHEADRTCVHFQVRVDAQSGDESWSTVQVPPGREAEARDLVARLRREVLQLPEPTAPDPAARPGLWIQE